MSFIKRVGKSAFFAMITELEKSSDLGSYHADMAELVYAYA